MASSIDDVGAWSTMEDVLLCECWVQVSLICGEKFMPNSVKDLVPLVRKWPWLVGGKF